LELAVEVQKAGGPDWINRYPKGAEKPTADPELASRNVRKYWKDAMKTWEARKEGIAQRFADRQPPVVFPDFGKDTNKGGAGNPSFYWLRFEDCPTDVDPFSEAQRRSPVKTDQARPPDSGTPIVRYYTDTVTRSPILDRLQRSGFLLTGARKIMYFSVVIPVLILIIGVAGILMLALTHAPDMRAAANVGILIAAVALVAWAFFGWFFRMATNRVAIAPFPFQDWSGADDRVIELRWDDKQKANRILVKRYIANCPLCEGKVRVQSGGRQFPGRLVGRCEASPTEHVFSFDPILRTGIYLHWPHPHGTHGRSER